MAGAASAASSPWHHLGSSARGSAAARPMLARAGAIRTAAAGRSSRSWTDSAASSARTGLRARSRRGWDMTHLLPEFRRRLPLGVQLDGELVALDESGSPTSPAVGADAARQHRYPGDVLRLRRAGGGGAGDDGAALLLSGGRCSRSWSRRTSRCGWWRRSRKGRRCSRPSASAASKGLWRSGCVIPTGRGSACG